MSELFYNPQYLKEFYMVATIAIFMAISPGADFVMIVKNSIFTSRTAGLFSALGVSLAIWIHVAYSIAGLAIIISQSLILFSIIKYLGATYLIYIGWKTFNSKSLNNSLTSSKMQKISNFSAFKIGFITNSLNPKTTIFFLSIFTQVVKPETPLRIQIVYGAIISIAHLLWFCLVAIFFTHPPLLEKFNRYKKYIEKIIGSVLIGFGLKVATASNN